MPSLHDTPTSEDQQLDLERQYANWQEGHMETIFCPWCGAGNAPDKPTCCGSFKVGVDAIGERQLKSVIRQLKEVRLGSRKTIKCPYCGIRVKKEASAGHPSEWPRPMVDPFCCDKMHDAAMAIVEKLTFDKLAEHKSRVEEGMSKK